MSDASARWLVAVVRRVHRDWDSEGEEGDHLQQRRSVGEMDVPVAISPVRGVSSALFRVAAHPGDALFAHTVDAVSKDMSAVRVASTAVRCGDSLQGGDSSFAVGVDLRLVSRVRV